MKVHLCIRETLDWGDLERLPDRILPKFRAKFETWHQTFTMPYGTFRQRLKALTELNLSRVEGAVLTSLDAVPHGELVVPVDDNDWVSPRLAHEIRRAARPGRIGFYWTREVLEPSRRRTWKRRWRRLRRRLRGRRDGYFCATNNYALTNGPDARPLMISHVKASDFFEANRERVHDLARLLSIQNRNLASQTALAHRQPTLSREEMIERFEEYRGLYREWRLSRRLRWAQPCLDGMAELMDDVRVR